MRFWARYRNPVQPHRRYRHLRIVPFLLALALSASACSGHSPDPYGEHETVEISQKSTTIEIKNIKFQPKGIRVKPGTAVTWVNRDKVVHNVRQVQSAFLSPDVLNQGDTFTFTFNEPGTYRYVCTYHHPNQLGVVIVEKD